MRETGDKKEGRENRQRLTKMKRGYIEMEMGARNALFCTYRAETDL